MVVVTGSNISVEELAAEVFATTETASVTPTSKASPAPSTVETSTDPAHGVATVATVHAVHGDGGACKDCQPPSLSVFEMAAARKQAKADAAAKANTS